MKRLFLPQTVEAAPLLVVEEQAGEGLVFAVEHLETHDLVVGEDAGSR